MHDLNKNAPSINAALIAVRTSCVYMIELHLLKSINKNVLTLANFTSSFSIRFNQSMDLGLP